MIDTQFIFNGGLGNQIFQYLASKYIDNNISSSKVSYSLSDSILKGNRNFQLNKLLIQPLNIKSEYQNPHNKIFSKVIDNLIFLKEEDKTKIKFLLNLMNNQYEQQLYPSNFSDPVLKLYNDLNLIKHKKNNLKISGYWQNPTIYINDLKKYSANFIDTKNLLPIQLKPNQYISIHIRRGDYYSRKDISDFYFSKFSPIKFIILSLQLLPQEDKNLPVIVLSDDKLYREEIKNILSKSLSNKFTCFGSNNNFEDWAILRHSSINICSNSTFSYTAALLNNENKNRKLRCIVPQWINNCQTAFEKGWLKPEGFIEI